MRTRALGLLVVGLVALPAVGRAQSTAPVTLDQIVARVDSDVIQSLEVRQVRILKLLGPAVLTDADALDGLITRRLELADVARYQVAEPTAADLAGRRQRWQATLNLRSPDDLTGLLHDAGMSEARLAAWFRDDARLEAIENQRFAGAPATRDQVLSYIRDHSRDFAQADGRPANVDDAATQAKARAAIAAANRATAVANWVDLLRQRAQIIR